MLIAIVLNVAVKSIMPSGVVMSVIMISIVMLNVSMLRDRSAVRFTVLNITSPLKVSSVQVHTNISICSLFYDVTKIC